MIAVILDAIVFAYDGDLHSTAIDDYLETLTGFFDLTDTPPFQVVVSPYSSYLLEETQSYPYWERMERIPQVQRRDVITVVEGILKRGVPTHAISGCDFLLLEEPSCDPGDHLLGRPAPFVEHYHQLAAICDLYTSREPAHTPAILATKGVNATQPTIVVRGAVVEGDCQTELPYALPHRYQRSLPHVTCLWELIKQVDLFSVLQLAPLVAIECAINQHPAATFSWGSKTYRWSVHSEFLSAAKEHGFLDEPEKAKQLLKACAELSIGENQRLTHPLRTGKEATKPQRVRKSDGALARRRDLDYEYHLHYWETSTGPQFAWLGVHEDFYIPE